MENNAPALKMQPEKNEMLLEWAERIIQQRQYETLDALRPRAVDAAVRNICPGDVTCLFRISELVFHHQEGSLKQLTTVLNALHAAGASCLMLLQCQDGRAELYLGAVNKQRYHNAYYLNTIREILRTGIEGNLPGTELVEIVSRQDIESKLTDCLDNGFDSQCVTAISCVAADMLDEAKSVPGIENLLEAVGRKNFSLMVLADPLNREQIRNIRQGYEELSTQLSAESETSMTIQIGSSVTLSENHSENITDTVSQSISKTQSHTSGTSWNTAKQDGKQAGAAAAGKLALTGARIMSKGNPMVIIGTNVLRGVLQGNRPSDSEGGSENETIGSQEQRGETKAHGRTDGTGKSVASSENISIHTVIKNRQTQEMLNRLDWYLKWLNRCENFGMFNCCAYVISSNAGLNMMVAGQYQALMQGGSEMSQPVSINTWTRENGVEHVKDSLMHMMHPVMQCSEFEDGLSPAMLLSSRELSRQMALPQHSVVGLTVMEYASFGREVVRKTPIRSGKVMKIGSVSHMGKITAHHPVILDMQSMASHTFVAGTNGSGKSNTVFRMLEELMKASIPFMVIEPAKGEYKNVFGKEPSVRVYGTNSRKSELLRINPFWFNDDVDVLEHINKLIDVFNASWSMYAAMPAVLKAAIEGAYRACGWNLKKSTCRGGQRIFPTVEDVLAQFNEKMNSTAFSQEVKGNYIGALSTRMESLCNGIYGEIFGGRNFSDEELFDSNVIIDLSRVGAAETKAMIMGMLIIRLQEYRMKKEAMNLPLRHITVLEEAHHLLRRTSLAQSEDGANLLGKSVEMISNAIAEMRSYGEGFIIVDQSPGLMDMSVMRNTNTKIILRLPESGDREMAGKTMGLTQEQINELSRLKTGSCVIYQKDWLEAVVCQVDRAKHEETLYSYQAGADEEVRDRKKIVDALLSAFGFDFDVKQEEIEQAVLSCGISGSDKKKLLREFSSQQPNRQFRSDMICKLIGAELELPLENTSAAAQEWLQEQYEDEELLCWGEEKLPLLIEMYVKHMAQSDEQWKELAALLYSRNTAQELKASRGRALARLCPMYCKKQPLTDKDKFNLQKDVEQLQKAGEADQMLSELLKRSLEQDVIRMPQQLTPYTEIVWNLMGGQKTWDRLYGLLEKKQLQQWDSEARQVLRSEVAADERTETSVLSLFLQCRGKQSSVKSIYNAWLREAMKIGR